MVGKALSMAASIDIIVTPGFKELTGRLSSLEDLAQILAPVDRRQLVRHSVRVLNSLAVSRQTGLADSQEAFLEALPVDLRARYRDFAATSDAPVQLLHPAQQLVLVHAAARYGHVEGGMGLGNPAARAAWATACLYVNDHLTKDPVLAGGLRSWEKALHLFSEEAARWELINPSRPDKALARIRALFTTVAARTPELSAAADRLRGAFIEQLGIDMETAYNLTAFLILHWTGESRKRPADPDAALVNRQTWLENCSIPLDQFDRYLGTVSLRLEEIVPAFDALKVGMSFRDVLPFRRSPLFRIDDNGVAFLAPQLMSEKGGIDFLWLLTNPPGGAREKHMFTDDFSLLYENYIRMVLEDLGPWLGGTYVPDVAYSGADGAGQIDGLILSGRTLAVVEVKASLIRQILLASGTVDAVRDDLERKFVGDRDNRKGLSQLAHAIQWLADERRAGRIVRGIDLRPVDTVIPILVIAERHLRFPGVGQWFDYQLQQMLRPVWARVGPVILCGTEDLENLEHLARRGTTRIMDVFLDYSRRAKRAQWPLWQYYEPTRGPHPRLNGLMDTWFKELVDRRIMLK